MKIIEKIWKNNVKIYDKIIYVYEIIISLILSVSLYKILYKYQEFGNISIVWTTVFFMSILFLIITIYFNIKKYKKIIEKLFLTFVIPIGIAFVVLLPPNWSPDEEGHIFRAYDLSMGNIVTPLGEKNEGDIYVPKQILELAMEKGNINYLEIHKFIQEKPYYDELVSVQTPFKTYFFGDYIVGGIIFAFSRMMNINFLMACYIIKFIHFILFIIVGYHCIRIIPFGKLLLSIYLFLPMIIQQTCSLSADAFINSISILFIVYNLKLIYQNRDLSIKQRLIYYGLSAIIALCKFVYFPLTFMSLLLLKNKEIRKVNKKKLVTVSIIIGVSLASAWFAYTQNYVDVREYIKEANVKPTEQAKFILGAPAKYIVILKNTIEKNGLYYLLTFAGSELGYANINIPQIYIFIMLFLLFSLPFFEKNDNSLEKWQKIVTNVIFVLLLLLILTGLYLTWTPLKYETVAGVQGRYFIPVLLLLLLTMINKNKNFHIENIEIKYFILFFILNICPITIIMSKFG